MTKRKFPKLSIKVLILIFILTLGLVFLYARPSILWKTYTSSSEDYSIKYPNNFLFTPVCGDNDEIVFATDKVDCAPGFPSKGKLLMWIIVYKGNHVNEFLQPGVDGGGANAEWQVDSTSKKNVDGTEAIEILWKDKQNNLRNEVVLFKNDKTYRLTQLSESDYEKERELFNQIVSTFKFTK